MAREETRGKIPLKVWDNYRNVRKGIVVGSFDELLCRCKEKLDVPSAEHVRIVLECDGTQIEDGDYFQTLAENTVLLLLRHNERWFPSGVDAIKAALASIPKIVYETIYALSLHDETPSWKIMDNKGRVTVVLHWDQRHGHHHGSGTSGASGGGGGGGSSGGGGGPSGCGPSGSGSHHTLNGLPIGGGGSIHSINGGSLLSSQDRYSPSRRATGLLSAQSSVDKSSSSMGGGACGGSGINVTVPAPQRYSSPQITVINHDDPQSAFYHAARRLSKQGGSFDSTISASAVHVHTPECAHHVHTPSRAGSPSGTDNCDFHCCALHEEGRKIAVHKSVATSPIQDGLCSPQQGACGGGGGATSKTSSMACGSSGATSGASGSGMEPPSSVARRPSVAKGHVRFLDIGPGDSSESETENTVMEDDQSTSEKFLLLIDQLSVDQKRHLSIKDIGIILERLSAKILDVERLDRESESDDCYNWTIKATIRGEVLRELGVIYNGNYYAISEHPGYKDDNEENGDEVEDEDEDRL